MTWKEIKVRACYILFSKALARGDMDEAMRYAAKGVTAQEAKDVENPRQY